MTTALIAISPHNGNEPRQLGSVRSNAVFVAHLIATAAHVPQTRTRRRAEPGQASAAYSALGQWPNDTGGTVSRSL